MKFQELVKNIEENKDAVSNIDLKSVEEIAKRIDEVRSNNKTVLLQEMVVVQAQHHILLMI